MNHRMLLFVALTFPPAVGCQWSDSMPSADESIVDERQLPIAAPGSESASVSTAKAAHAATTTLVVMEDAAPSPVDVPLQEPFEPPYPHRDNLFRRPSVESAPQLVRQTDEQEVLLKSFINVDEIRALLEIDGRVTAVPAGGSLGDIRVKSISSHGVTLKKGRAEGQVTLSTDEVD